MQGAGRGRRGMLATSAAAPPVAPPSASSRPPVSMAAVEISLHVQGSSSKENHGKSAIPKWNFHKIIINRHGKVDDTFASITNPSSKKFIIALEEALNK